MSILTSLYTGASGMTAHGDAMSIVGDNISNSSTVGFRGSRASFEDVLGGRMSNGQRLGAGVRMNGPETMFGQGAIQNTGNSLDLAIGGRGFFAVRGAHQGQEGTYLTRDGRFHLDNSGTVVNPAGLRLQGYTVDGTGKMGSSTGDLVLAGQESPPKPTERVDLTLNLDAGETTPTAPWDPANPAATSSFATSATVYDSLGTPHRVDMYMRAAGGGSWEYHAMVDGGEITGGTAGTPMEIASGTLTFNSDGALDTETGTSPGASFTGASAAQPLTFDFGDSLTTDGGTGLGGTTGFAGPTTVTGIEQDGWASGTLLDVSVADDGVITGRFSNGQTRPVAQVALGMVASDAGLERVGNQLFAATRDSGEMTLAAAATGGRGSVAGGALESSNVDLGNELVTLIAYQRAFQSSARIVSTADEMLAEVANLKR